MREGGGFSEPRSGGFDQQEIREDGCTEYRNILSRSVRFLDDTASFVEKQVLLTDALHDAGDRCALREEQEGAQVTRS